MGVLNVKKLFVFINTGGDKNIEYAVVKGKKVLEKGVCPAERLIDIKNKNGVDCVRASVNSDLNYTETANIKSFNKKFIPAASRKYINDQFIFTDPYVLKHKIVKKGEKQFSVFLSAMQKSDIDTVFHIIDNLSLPVEYITNVEIAILNLSKYIIDQDNSTIIWAKGGMKLQFVVNNGVIISREASEYDNIEDIDTNSLENNPLLLGDLSDKNSSINSDKLKKFSFNTDEVLKYPEIYGLFFCDKNFNFLDSDYRNKIDAYKLSILVLFAALIFSLILSSASALQYLDFRKAKQQFMLKKTKLLEDQNSIKNKMPTQKEIDMLSNISKFNKKANKQLNLGGFLSWLTNIIPANAVIDYIDVAPKIVKANINNNEINTETQNGQIVKTGLFTAKINISISGEYKTAKREAVDIIKKISQKAEPNNSSFEYIKSKNKATLKTELKIDGSNF